ncbi:MAG: hypothetical protein LBB45_01230 [Methanobrevibacter sp.]|nr:hypothetical protein [Candidatus Methanovirga basalitermitum]
MFCKYCGHENRTSGLKCSKCGKPLSLLPNDQSNSMLEKNLSPNQDSHENIRKDSIKWRYINHQNQEKKYNIDYDDNNYSDEFYRNKSIMSHENNNLDDGKIETVECFIEWDVIIASSLIFIILTAVFNRILPAFGYVFTLLTSLSYILIATKNKNTLILAIPLSFLTTSAISAFLSL